MVADIQSENSIKLESKQIVEIAATNSITGVKSYGYVLKQNYNLNYHRTASGYFFDNNSGCFIHGTMVYGDNGVNLFIPSTGATHYLFQDICPPRGSAWAKQNTKK